RRRRAAALSALTGLAVRAAVTQSSPGWARVLVPRVGSTAAAIGVVARVDNHAGAAGKFLQMPSRYGPVKGRFVDARARLGHPPNDAAGPAGRRPGEDQGKQGPAGAVSGRSAGRAQRAGGPRAGPVGGGPAGTAVEAAAMIGQRFWPFDPGYAWWASA